MVMTTNEHQMSSSEIAENCSEDYRPCGKEHVPAGSAFVDCSIGGDHRFRYGRTPDRRYMEIVDYAGGGRVGYARLREFVQRSALETQVDAAITASIHEGGHAKLPWSEELEREIRGRLDPKRVLDDPEADPEAAIGKVVLGSNWSIHLLYPEAERRSVAARELGRRGGLAGGAKGGSSKTEAKAAAARENGAKGGRRSLEDITTMAWNVVEPQNPLGFSPEFASFVASEVAAGERSPIAIARRWKDIDEDGNVPEA